MAKLCGIWGKPYIDLEPHLDTVELPDIDREIRMGLSRVETSYTGGTLKWMNVVAPWVRDDPYPDAMQVIERFSPEELEQLVSLADDPAAFAGMDLRSLRFGDETDHPLTRAQMLYLKYQHGVYFPWKVAYHLLPNHRWEDKHTGEGKAFTEEAREVFPRTVGFIESLPFREIGRVVIFGLEANDHAPAHRDAEPGKSVEIGHSISFCPRGDKRLYLCDPARGSYTPVAARAYWFNDMDYHGVEADPYFRYSVRIDGVFERAFLRALEEDARRRK
jgi:hypothetical protein